ncbi:MAG: DMT family transporter [Flectobacillus sp.]|nr:DMT family transporter [Flectobacillus sp.]
MKENKLSKSVQFMLVSTLCFTTMQSLVKFLPQFDSFQHIFFRSVIGWVMSVAYLLNQGISLRGKNIKMLIFRGIIGSAGMFSFFYILTRIPFGSSVAFKYLSPIFTAIFAVIFLKEKISGLQWFFFFISFVGILLLKGFDSRIGLFDAGIGLFSAVLGGLLVIVIRKIGDDDHHLVILHYFMFISALGSGIVAFQDWKTPVGTEWLWLLAIGLVGFVAQNFFTKAIQEPSDDVSFLAILRYSEVIYALIIGYFLFHEVYTLQSIVGIALIFAGLLLSFRYKS